ncbi:MAG: amidohydrolase [bacterium]|nr:amidohydrolase [bacterium]
MDILTDALLRQKAKEVEGYVKRIRGHLHRFPETTANEIKTSEFLRSELSELGLPIEIVSKTGFIATLITGKPGKTLALRADLDALPITESSTNLKGPKKHVSEIPGVSHVCGHDGHMAMLLGVARVLCSIKEGFMGTILFCFEEGEEAGTGITGMMNALAKRQVDAVWGVHLASFMDSGTISVEKGPRMAGEAAIDFEVVGRGGHGSRPDLSINPVFAAASVLTALGTAWPNRIDANETVTLGITTIHGGIAPNIIPDKVKITGTLRFFNVLEGEKAVSVLRDVAFYAAKAHLCSIEFSEKAFRVAPPVINSEALSQLAEKALIPFLPPGSVVSANKWYASESFRAYGGKYPALLAFLGIRNETYGSGAEHHNSHFDIDEDALGVGILATLKFAHDFLQT